MMPPYQTLNTGVYPEFPTSQSRPTMTTDETHSNNTSDNVLQTIEQNDQESDTDAQ